MARSGPALVMSLACARPPRSKPRYLPASSVRRCSYDAAAFRADGRRRRSAFDVGVRSRSGAAYVMAAQRTWLAWWRTALGATAGALAVGRFAPQLPLSD